VLRKHDRLAEKSLPLLKKASAPWPLRVRLSKLGPSTGVAVSVSTLVGKGIYPIPEAARLCKVSERRIRYWLKRIDSEGSGENGKLWHGEHRPIKNKVVLGFLDLQEVRFVEAFLAEGVTWRLLRAAHEIAKIRYQTEHPFCTRDFITDGKHIIEELKHAGGHIEYEEIAKTQKVFPAVVRPFVRDLEFSSDKRLLRWWPLGSKRSVVLDPQRQFGQPIVSRAGIATEVLYLAVRQGQSEKEVASWYEIEESAVRDAVNFETRLAA
jgi:uncharacterized protein (DUF433 family)/transposase